MRGPTMSQMMVLYRHLLRLAPSSMLEEFSEQIGESDTLSPLQQQMLQSLKDESAERNGRETLRLGPMFRT